MDVAQVPIDDKERVKTLRGLQILETPLEERFERITRLAKKLFKVPIAGISLVDEKRQWFKSVQGLETCDTSREMAFCSHAILGDEALVVRNTLNDERFFDHPFVVGEPNIRFYAGYPVRAANGKKLGALCLIDTKPRKYTPGDMSTHHDLAALVESELLKEERSYAHRLYRMGLDEAERAATVDPLTRLWNHIGMSHILDLQMEEARIKNAGFGVAMGDVDHLKMVNQTVGQRCGDEVLRHVGRRLIGSCREMDVVGRWGGGYFLIIIDAPDKDVLIRVLDRMRSAILENEFKTNYGPVRITATFGASAYSPEKETERDELIRLAIQALARGKASGRNRVMAQWAS